MTLLLQLWLSVAAAAAVPMVAGVDAHFVLSTDCILSAQTCHLLLSHMTSNTPPSAAGLCKTHQGGRV